jgi:subtilisin family serine protease
VGPTYDGRIKPDVMAMGEGTYVATGYVEWGWEYYNGNGTSFATPVLAGAVACLRQARPYASVQEICDVIRQCGNHAGNPDNYHGYGIPDLSQAFELLATTESVDPYSGKVLSVYPNPAQGEVHVMLNQGTSAEVTVFDITGRLLFNCHFNGLNHTTLESRLSSLTSGVYFINAVSEQGSQTLKLVIAQ